MAFKGSKETFYFKIFYKKKMSSFIVELLEDFENV